MDQEEFEAIDSIREVLKSILIEIECNTQLLSSPHIVFKPKIFLDGTLWCALYGENLQVGISGFGTSPKAAVDDFNQNFHYNLPEDKKL